MHYLVAMERARATLGVPLAASDKDIAIAYRRRAKEVHPDKGGTTALFQQLQAAYEKLRANSLLEQAAVSPGTDETGAVDADDERQLARQAARCLEEVSFLFVVCLLFVVCCLLFAVCCLLFLVCCLLFAVCCLLFVVCCCCRSSFC